MILYEDENITVRGEPSGPSIFIHIDWKGHAFTKALYKKYLEVFDYLKELLSDYEEILSLIDIDDERALKWQDMFGMKPLATFRDCVLFRRARWD